MPRLRDKDLSLPRTIEFVELVPSDPVEDNGAAGHVDPHCKRLSGAEHADQAILAKWSEHGKWENPMGPAKVG